MLVLTKRFKFCAAHRYYNSRWTEGQNRAVFGDDYKIHGHNYELEVSLTGSVNPDTGFIAELGNLQAIVQERVISHLDHAHLEVDFPWFKDRRPTSENLVLYIWQELAPHMPEGVRLVRVRLYETPTIFSEYDGQPMLVSEAEGGSTP